MELRKPRSKSRLGKLLRKDSTLSSCTDVYSGDFHYWLLSSLHSAALTTNLSMDKRSGAHSSQLRIIMLFTMICAVKGDTQFYHPYEIIRRWGDALDKALLCLLCVLPSEQYHLKRFAVESVRSDNCLRPSLSNATHLKRLRENTNSSYSTIIFEVSSIFEHDRSSNLEVSSNLYGFRTGKFVDWHDFGAPSRISQPRRQFRP